MNITLGSTALADDANNRTTGAWGGPRIESGGWEQQVQVSMPVRAANATLIARGNLVGTLVFSATWQAASTSAAIAKAASWQKPPTGGETPDGCPRAGTLSIDEQSWGAAVVERLTVRVRGVEVTASYSIKYTLPAASAS